MAEVKPEWKMSDDAVELLEAFLSKKLTQIAEKAVQIVHRAKKDDIGCAEVTRAINLAFCEQFPKKK